MTEEDVVRILGKPDEIRVKGKLGIVAESYRWVYGVKRKGEFPLVGSVIFNERKVVDHIFCPSKGISNILNQRAVVFSELPQKTNEGRYCEIERVFKKDNSNYLEVSIVNEGDQPWLYPHDNTGIRFSIILDIFDVEKNIILREPLFGYHSPISLDRSKWPVIKVLPDQRFSEDVPIWWRNRNDGVLYPGTYYVRVAFPFDAETFYGSNLVKWELKEPVNE